MNLLPHEIPDHILLLMPAEERKRLGKMGKTLCEVFAEEQVKNERELQGQMVQLLRLRGIEVGWGRTDVKSGYTVGWPDLTFCHHGRPIAVEVKMPGQDPRPEQLECHQRMRSNGWEVHVCRSVSELKGILDR